MSLTIYVALSVFIVLILLCLIFPIRLQLILTRQKRSISFSWLIFSLGSDLKEKMHRFVCLDRTILRREFKKKFKGKAEKAKRKRRLNLRILGRHKKLLLQVAPVFFHFLVDIFRAIRWERLSLEVEVATPDPSLTGVLCGGFFGVKHFTEHFFPEAYIRVRPDFVNEFPWGNAEAVFSIRSANLFASILKMFFALPKLQIVKTLLISKGR